MKLMGYKKCSTCKKAENWLNQNSISYTYQDVKEEQPTYEQLKQWHDKSGVEIKRMFNTSGIVYRELGLKDKLSDMSTEEALQLLSTNGMLLKRPLLIGNDFTLIGFKADKWEEKLQ